MELNKFKVDDIVWAMSADRRSITKVTVESIGITINRSATSVHYRLRTGHFPWGSEVPENRVFATHEEARTELNKATKHG